MKTLGPVAILILALLVSVPAVADIALIKTGSFYDDARNGFSSICFENKQEFTLSEDLSNQSEIAEQLQRALIRWSWHSARRPHLLRNQTFPAPPWYSRWW